MNKRLGALLCVLTLAGAGCSASPAKTVSMDLSAEKLTEISVTKDRLSSNELPAGQYRLTNEAKDGEDAALFSVYISDEQYDSMCAELKEQFVDSLRSGESMTLSLEEGNYLYAAATDEESGTYTSGLQGELQIRSE